MLAPVCWTIQHFRNTWSAGRSLDSYWLLHSLMHIRTTFGPPQTHTNTRKPNRISRGALHAVSVRCCAPIMGMKLKLDPSLGHGDAVVHRKRDRLPPRSGIQVLEESRNRKFRILMWYVYNSLRNISNWIQMTPHLMMLSMPFPMLSPHLTNLSANPVTLSGARPFWRHVQSGGCWYS